MLCPYPGRAVAAGGGAHGHPRRRPPHHTRCRRPRQRGRLPALPDGTLSSTYAPLATQWSIWGCSLTLWVGVYAAFTHPAQALALLEERVRLGGGGRLATTLCGLDEALGGGIPMGKLTEVVGPSGIGKTQVRF